MPSSGRISCNSLLGIDSLLGIEPSVANSGFRYSYPSSVSCHPCSSSCAEFLRFRLRLKKNMQSTEMRAKATTPPTTPPAIAPTFTWFTGLIGGFGLEGVAEVVAFVNIS